MFLTWNKKQFYFAKIASFLFLLLCFFWFFLFCGKWTAFMWCCSGVADPSEQCCIYTTTSTYPFTIWLEKLKRHLLEFYIYKKKDAVILNCCVFNIKKQVFGAHFKFCVRRNKMSGIFIINFNNCTKHLPLVKYKIQCTLIAHVSWSAAFNTWSVCKTTRGVIYI